MRPSGCVPAGVRPSGGTSQRVRALGRPWGEAYEEQRTAGKVSPEMTERVRATVRSYLDVCDGMFVSPSMLRDRSRCLDIGFYRGYVLPTIIGILNEEPYRGKYLGLGADTGHFNFMTGWTFDEDGTKTLRHSFEAAAVCGRGGAAVPWSLMAWATSSCFRAR